MNTSQPRLRMFAGPNGSGKSTLKTLITKEMLGHYLNPDEMEKDLNNNGFDLGSLGFLTTGDELKSFFRQSQFLNSAGLSGLADELQLIDEHVRIGSGKSNSYCASVLADFCRRKLIENKISFTFETVMSSPDKIDTLKHARTQGFRTYLYYIATNDPTINVLRVRNRVKMGGHTVPEDKIASRYSRSLELLREAIRHTNRAYIFDNSFDLQAKTWIAEITDGHALEMRSTLVPDWFKKAVLEKL